MSDISLQKGMKVELVPGAETVYPRALAGMQGIVRGTKDDDFGFPQAFIEWDKNHWRYNGEQDGWTFASHFRPVENEEPEIIGAEIHDVPATPPRQPTEEEEQRVRHAATLAARPGRYAAPPRPGWRHRAPRTAETRPAKPRPETRRAKPQQAEAQARP